MQYTILKQSAKDLARHRNMNMPPRTMRDMSEGMHNAQKRVLNIALANMWHCHWG
jgi:hypothetical protein